MWENQTVLLLGGGPSLKKIDLDLIAKSGHRKIGVNNSYRLGNWVDICWFGDTRWFNWHKKELRATYTGLVVSCDKNQLDVPWVKVLRRMDNFGIEPIPGKVRWNANSGGSAINFAYHLGVRKIVLIGFDMQADKYGNDNWHNDHEVHPPIPYDTFITAFKSIARDAKRLGLEIVNVNRESELTMFPFVNLEDVL